MREIAKYVVRKHVKEIKTALGTYDCESILEYCYLPTDSKATPQYENSVPCLIKKNGICPSDGLYDLLDFDHRAADAFEAYLMNVKGNRMCYRLPQLGESGILDLRLAADRTHKAYRLRIYWRIRACCNLYARLVGEVPKEQSKYPMGTANTVPELRWAIWNNAYEEIAGKLETSRKAAIRSALEDLSEDWTWKDLRKAGYSVHKFNVTRAD